jgi:shikimate dehydrogenase
MTADPKLSGLACVIGHPVGHSLSPVMHNAAFEAMGLPHRYVALDVAPERVLDAVRGAAALGFVGMNVTIPHKAAVIPALVSISRTAEILRSVNTISFGPDGPTGESTDGPGFIASLAEEGVDVAGKRVVLLGSGGSARALAYALCESRAAHITVAGRTPERVQALVDAVSAASGLVSMETCDLRGEAIERALSGADLLINTTPLGMHPNPDDMPPVPPESLRPGLVVADIIFNPPRTRLLEAAGKRGCEVIDGRGMLVHQGALSFGIWTGIQPPVEVMRRALDEGLRARGLAV